jgi:hypothetical protein
MSETSVKTKTAAYLMLAQEIKDLKARQEALKGELEPYLAQADTNSRGSYVIPFEEPLEVFGTRYKGLQKVRKESKVLNEERVIKFLKEQAVDESPDGRPFADSRWYTPILKIEHVDQDALWDLYARDLITKEEFDKFFDTTISYSFLPTKE